MESEQKRKRKTSEGKSSWLTYSANSRLCSLKLSTARQELLWLWTFFPKDSYLGVLRLFLRVLEVARSRRLGSVGEVSVWPGRAREILAFLGKKVGKLYFWENVVSTFPLALFDHFQKFTCAEEASRRSSQGGSRPFFSFFLKKPPQIQKSILKWSQLSEGIFGRFS